jgi:hypothetical protein
MLKKTFKKISLSNNNSCAPGQGNKTTCFNKSSLIKIATLWNKNNPGNNININGSNSKVWGQINNKLSEKCNTETCWLKQDFLKNKDFNSFFKPNIPNKWKKEKNTWLTTTDIEKVLFQYENAIKDFKFLGVVPVDFDYEYNVGKCVVDELCKLNIEHLKKKKNINRIGIVFNLDAHDEPGSHWVSLYSDFKKGEVYYYDSYGIYPPEEVKILMERISTQGIKIKGEPFKIYYNDIRHQYKNSECGVYSMHFITEFLNGKSFKEIIQNKISDEDMNKNRFSKFYI